MIPTHHVDNKTSQGTVLGSRIQNPLSCNRANNRFLVFAPANQAIDSRCLRVIWQQELVCENIERYQSCIRPLRSRDTTAVFGNLSSVQVVHEYLESTAVVFRKTTLRRFRLCKVSVETFVKERRFGANKQFVKLEFMSLWSNIDSDPFSAPAPARSRCQRIVILWWKSLL